VVKENLHFGGTYHIKLQGQKERKEETGMKPVANTVFVSLTHQR
jgi:hypothetical protein